MVGRILERGVRTGVFRRGVDPVQLNITIAAIDAENATSVRLHTRFGFEKVGHFREVGFKFDRWLDVVYMQRLIHR